MTPTAQHTASAAGRGAASPVRLLIMQRARLNEIAGGRGNPPERLQTAAADVLRTTFENMDDMIVFFRSLHLLPAARQDLIRAERRSYHERFRQLVDEGIAAGAFRRDVPADIVVQYFLSAVNQLGTWYRPDGALTPDQIGQHFTDLLMAGLHGS